MDLASAEHLALLVFCLHLLQHVLHATQHYENLRYYQSASKMLAEALQNLTVHGTFMQRRVLLEVLSILNIG